jgi:hypothetical protein
VGMNRIWETRRRVGQVVNLQRVVNPLLPRLSPAAGPISNRPRVANLPHNGRRGY